MKGLFVYTNERSEQDERLNAEMAECQVGEQTSLGGWINGCKVLGW